MSMSWDFASKLGLPWADDEPQPKKSKRARAAHNRSQRKIDARNAKAKAKGPRP
jgi:hypothetical protein